MQLIKIIILSFMIMVMCSNINAYSRHAGTEGCYAGNQPHNYHASGGSLSGSTSSGKLNEDAHNLLFYNSVSGRTETRYPYIYPGKNSYVKLDCETKDMVYKNGLGRRSNLDNIQQALFFSSLTSKQPATVIYDTDGKMGRFEYRIKSVCEIVRVVFLIRSLTKSYMAKAGGDL